MKIELRKDPEEFTLLTRCLDCDSILRLYDYDIKKRITVAGTDFRKAEEVWFTCKNCGAINRFTGGMRELKSRSKDPYKKNEIERESPL